jgi:hypothetical protein
MLAFVIGVEILAEMVSRAVSDKSAIFKVCTWLALSLLLRTPTLREWDREAGQCSRKITARGFGKG